MLSNDIIFHAELHSLYESIKLTARNGDKSTIFVESKKHLKNETHLFSKNLRGNIWLQIIAKILSTFYQNTH